MCEERKEELEPLSRGNKRLSNSFNLLFLQQVQGEAEEIKDSGSPHLCFHLLHFQEERE